MAGLNPGLARELLLLGMAFKVEEKDNRPRRALMFFRAFWQAGVLDEKTRQMLMKDPDNIQRVLNDCHVLRKATKPKRSELLGMTYDVGESFILVGPQPGQKLDMRRLLGGNGYFLMITEAGLDNAEEVVRVYASRITMPQFRDAWDWAWQELGKAWPKMNDTKAKTLPDSSDSRREIPPAPVAPEEWDW